jgi:endonuclease YncB( thermonuclease family)
MIETKGKVTQVLDGDTIKVELTLRLNRIDALETKGIEADIGGLAAKQYLTDRLLGKHVDLGLVSRDYYKRVLSEIILKGININDELLEKKYAEVYKTKNHNNGKLDI